MMEQTCAECDTVGIVDALYCLACDCWICRPCSLKIHSSARIFRTHHPLSATIWNWIATFLPNSPTEITAHGECVLCNQTIVSTEMKARAYDDPVACLCNPCYVLAVTRGRLPTILHCLRCGNTPGDDPVYTCACNAGHVVCRTCHVDDAISVRLFPYDCRARINKRGVDNLSFAQWLIKDL